MQPASRYRWELLALLFLAFFFHQGDRAIFGVVLPAIKTDLQLTDSQLGLVGSVLFATLAILMPVTGYLGDIWSRKWIITISLIFWSFATMVTGMARGMVGLVAFRSVATAGGEAFYAPAAYSLLAQFHQKTRALAMSVHQCAVYLGVIASGYSGRLHRRTMGLAIGLLHFRRRRNPAGDPLLFPPEEFASRFGSSTTARLGIRVGPIEALGVLFRTPTAVLLTVAFTGYRVRQQRLSRLGADFCRREVPAFACCSRRLFHALLSSWRQRSAC